ncbi:M23 family metallopeptidase [Rubeoparvulum massiliense]|uniref:M23 family metallopeptidase n=1 Tax=Rubeoparvulum massiliense TaxID=1631346 RepID=UPI00065E38C9|nr:M23 family metallopeptidase [Rubeoparvulum massiliense]
MRTKWWRWQTAMILFIIALIILNGEGERYGQGKRWIYEALLDSQQFPQLKAWYEAYFAEGALFLPAYTPGSSTPVEYQLPSQTVMKRTRYSVGQGIWIETSQDDYVVAVDTGWVRYAGMMEQLGNTIILQLPGQQQVWYANLGTIYVKENDWIVQGTRLADVYTTNTGRGRYYFAWKKDGVFINPEDVIPFATP